MLTAIQGVYQNGKIVLAEEPENVREDTPVVVTFLTRAIYLREYGIEQAQASELRERLATFAEDWDSPEMDVYDDYDAVKAGLPTG
jgi:hypothetical protein